MRTGWRSEGRACLPACPTRILRAGEKQGRKRTQRTVRGRPLQLLLVALPKVAQLPHVAWQAHGGAGARAVWAAGSIPRSGCVAAACLCCGCSSDARPGEGGKQLPYGQWPLTQQPLWFGTGQVAQPPPSYGVEPPYHDRGHCDCQQDEQHSQHGGECLAQSVDAATALDSEQMLCTRPVGNREGTLLRRAFRHEVA